MDTFEDWIDKLIYTHSLCEEYKNKVDRASSNKQLMDIVLDANGVSYLCEMMSKGIPLSYDIITSRFGLFINGRYISEHKSAKFSKYTSELYCQYDSDIKISCTLTTILGCKCNVIVPDNYIGRVYLDQNCEVNIICPPTSSLIVEYWGDNPPTFTGKVELNKH